jgi:pimeloyl-ACP methyl ester carboxylesterase
MPTFEYLNKTVFYEIDGQGKPIIILNGIMMSTKSWIPFLPTIKEEFQVIRLDFFDQGQSSKLIDETYTQDIQVELLKALLENLHISAVSIVGISYGGEVALSFAAMYPEKVERLIVFNSTAYTSSWLKDIGRGWIKAGKTRDGSHYYKTTIPVIYSPYYYETRIEWMKKREEVLIPIFSDPLFLDQMERLTLSAESYDIRPVIKNITMPVLIVSAELDYLTPIDNQEYLHKQLINSEWIKLPFAGHASMYEKPLLFTTLVVGFFKVKDTQYNI